jgi:hypothetical protein
VVGALLGQMKLTKPLAEMAAALFDLGWSEIGILVSLIAGRPALI